MTTWSHMAKTAFANAVLKKPSPLLLLLEPSEKCNATCPFCYHWREQPDGDELTLDEIAVVLEDAWELGCRVFYLSGGEPTIHPKLFEILVIARRIGYSTTLTTNGSRLAKVLPAISPLLDGVTVSLDYAGPRQDQLRGIGGLFDDAVAGLKLAKTLQVNARINMSLYPANRDQVPGLLELAEQVGGGLHVRLMTRESKELDITTLSVEEAVEAARELLVLKKRNSRLLTPATYFQYIEQQRKFSCRLLSLLVTIDSSGRVYAPCPKYEGTKEKIAGSVREHRLASIWHSDAAAGLRQESAICTPSLDCYTSCILDISLLAGLSPDMLFEQLSSDSSLLSYFRKRMS